MDEKWTIKVTSMFLLLFFVVSLSSSVGGETEPNDSMDDPNVIGEGNTTGTIGLQSSSDEDMFRINAPVNSIVFYSLKKTDTGSSKIYMSTYGSDRVKLTGGYYYDSSSSVDVAGEVTRGYFLNLGSSDHFFIIISGRGEYSINVKYHFTNDPEDTQEPYDDPIKISEGKKITGKVYKVIFDHQEFEDEDLYYITVKKDVTVKATVTKTDSGDGVIYANLNDRPSASSSDIALEEEGESGSTSQYIYTYSGNEENVYLTVWGEGEYEIIIEEEGWGLGSDEAMLTMMGAAICLSLIMTLMPVLIVVVVIVIIVKSTKKSSKSKKIRKRE